MSEVFRPLQGLVPWVRQGECNGCGWCCQFHGMARTLQHGDNKPLDADDVRYYELRGGHRTPGGNAVFRIDMYAPCSAHDQQHKKCKVYKNRPEICKTFPVSPDQIEGTPCSYWFEYGSDLYTLRRGGQGSPHPTQPVYPSEEDLSQETP